MKKAKKKKKKMPCIPISIQWISIKSAEIIAIIYQIRAIAEIKPFKIGIITNRWNDTMVKNEKQWNSAKRRAHNYETKFSNNNLI